MTELRSGQRHGTRQPSRAVVFAVLSIVLFMSAVDLTIVATGLPTIGHALHARLNWTSWTISAYQLGLVVAMPVAGRVGDALGHRRVVLSAAVVFLASSLACALATDVYMLIAFRAIQALGGGAFAPAATGLVAATHGDRRAQAVGFFSTIFPSGAIAGPIIGGAIISEWSWRGIFLVNIPIGAVFIVLGLRYLPRSPSTGERVAPWGSVLLGGAVLLLMLAIARFGEPHSSALAPSVIGFFVGAVVLFGVFWYYNSRASIPVIPVRFLRERNFVAISTLNFVWGACAIGLITLFPLFAE
ncbi:MAG TPA: MFS transporter, partial [Acidimicrobiales bacterium]|nr:MFS transporter [Acidimicrobiales bacterium]